MSLLNEKSARMIIVNGDMVRYDDITFFFDLAQIPSHALLSARPLTVNGAQVPGNLANCKKAKESFSE